MDTGTRGYNVGNWSRAIAPKVTKAMSGDVIEGSLLRGPNTSLVSGLAFFIFFYPSEYHAILPNLVQTVLGGHFIRVYTEPTL